MDIQEARRAVGRPNRSAVQDSDFFPLAGGLNVVQTPLQMAPGELLDGLNYEPSTLGGYTRIQGYERLDGSIAPSAQPYYILNFTGAVPASFPAVGALVFSASTPVYLLEPPMLDNTGLAGYLVIATNGTGGGATFTLGENLRSGSGGGPIFGVAAGPAVINGAPTPALDTQYTVAAREQRRGLIAAVPGTGPVRGVVEYNGHIYAFRDFQTGGPLEGRMYLAWTADPTGFGWQQISPGFTLSFTDGGNEISQGDAILGGTSGATATVSRVVVESGDWAAGTAAGMLVFASFVGGPFVNGETIQDVTTTLAGATAVGTATAQKLLPGGTYDFRVVNFYGASGSIRLYGCDGVNQAFEFQEDSTGQPNGHLQSFVFIDSGMPVDAPNHIEAHRGRLWLSFPGGSVQPSSVNDPVVFNALQGAAELGVGYQITGMLGEMSPSQSAFYSTATLFIFTPQQTFTITGDGPNWILGPYAVDVGGIAFSIQRLGQGMFLNDRGFATFQAVQQLGNFALATVSQKIQPLIPGILANAVCSSVSKNKSLYRLFLSDGRYIAIGFKDLKITGITLCDLSQPMTCAWAGNTTGGAELLLAGGANGFVYQLDSGVQIDGAQLNAFLHTAFHFSKSPSRLKRYRRAQLDIQCDGPCTLQFAPDYSYGSSDVGSDAPRTLATVGDAPDPGVYADFNWSNGQIAVPTFKLEGSGTNMGIVTLHQSTNENPHNLQGVTLHKSLRRLDRSSNA